MSVSSAAKNRRKAAIRLRLGAKSSSVKPAKKSKGAK